MPETILVDDAGPIATITLNRPEKRNPIGPSTCGELVAALTAIKANATNRVVVLTGAGSVFSAGGDLSAMQAPSGPVATLPELQLAMHGLGRPIIAMVN